MKKNSLLKAIGIVTIVFMLLTWIIPTSAITDGKFANNGYNPMGIFDLLKLPFEFFNWSNIQKILNIDGASVELVSHVSTLLAFLSIGVFYKVINKTGAYANIVEVLTLKFKKNETLLIIISIVSFTLLSSLTGLTLLLLLLVPFVITLLLKANYSRVIALASTVLPILVGRACSITGCDITGVNNVVYGIKWTDNLIVKFVLLIIFMGLLILFVLKSNSPSDDAKEDPLYDKITKKNVKTTPLLLTSGFFIVILGLFMYNWYYVFGNADVTEAYNTITSNTISGYPFVQNLFGTLEPFGYWTGFTMCALLLILSLIIAFIYSLSKEDLAESLKDGIKAMGKPVVYGVLASSIMTFINYNVFSNSDNSSIFYTLTSWVNDNISFKTMPLATFNSTMYSIFMNDYSAISLQLAEVVNITSSTTVSLAVLCIQVIYGLISILTPTSIFLVAGLAYLDVPYKKWLTYIWKLFLSLFVLAILILLIVSII